MPINTDFWYGKKVLVTGHTGFKGSWLSILLHRLGAHITGVSLPNEEADHIYNTAKVNDFVDSYTLDINDEDAMTAFFESSRAEIVIHMAAQPLVKTSYINPLATIDTNVLGTAKVILAAAKSSDVRSMVVVTSDKCYENVGKVDGYVESDALGGRDPYSASKGACEIISRSLALSCLAECNMTIASARAGNVIGGGDFSENRLLPDIVRALRTNNNIDIRSPNSVRPWQHVLEPLYGYLVLAEANFHLKANWNGGWNFGPSQDSAITVKEIVDYLIAERTLPLEVKENVSSNFHEEVLLHVDSSKASAELGIKSIWDIRRTLDHTLDWYIAQEQGRDMRLFTIAQIDEYLARQSLESFGDE